MTPWVLHVDLDQFLAAVEVLRHPELRGLPVVVGGDGDPSKRGVVSTASYEAREHGVHSGLALRLAKRRSPDAVFLPVDRPHYEAVSAEVMAVLGEGDAVVEVLGWDEAFVGANTDDPEAMARRIQQRVLAATDLNCSVGIGQNKPQAKLATGFGKPNGIYRLTWDNWYEVLGERAPDALWGIGAKITKKLAGLGIHTVRELADADRAQLTAEFGPTNGPYLILLAKGRGDTEVVDTPYLARSHGRETTFQQNIADWDEVRAEIVRLARWVTEEITTEGRPAARVVVKVRYAPFITVTHGHTLAAPTMDGDRIEAAALDALTRFTADRPVRLLGVRAEFPR